ncbi:MAG: efflux RND transporter periplasmic adaptor subunit [Puniceicoccaceae bacterium]
MKLWLKLLILFAVFAVVVGALGFFKYNQILQAIAMGEQMAPPPPTVAVVEVGKTPWRERIPSVGSLRASEGIVVSAEVEGRVVEIHFESGQAVEKGDLLLVQDHSVETANLEAAEARRDLAEVDFTRADDLFARNTISKAEFDSARAERNRLEAEVAGIRALIAKKRIEAPFAGRLGIREVSLGELLTAGQAVAVLEASDPLYLDFTLPQRHLARLKEGQSVDFTVDAFEGRTFEGAVEAISPRIDPATRNVRVRAAVPNPDGVLRAGMFARLDLDLGTTREWLTVPDTAISYNSFGNGVYVVRELANEDDSTYQGVRQIFVEVVRRRGDLVAIDGKIEPGEKVVVAGIAKLRDRAEVRINNEVLPDAKKDPRPAEG